MKERKRRLSKLYIEPLTRKGSLNTLLFEPKVCSLSYSCFICNLCEITTSYKVFVVHVDILLCGLSPSEAN